MQKRQFTIECQDFPVLIEKLNSLLMDKYGGEDYDVLQLTEEIHVFYFEKRSWKVNGNLLLSVVVRHLDQEAEFQVISGGGKMGVARADSNSELDSIGVFIRHFIELAQINNWEFISISNEYLINKPSLLDRIFPRK